MNQAPLSYNKQHAINLEETCKSKQSIANDICDYANNTANFAEALSVRTGSILKPIMRYGGETVCETQPVEEYPPLFDNLRDCLDLIMAALNRIDRSLDLTEL